MNSKSLRAVAMSGGFDSGPSTAALSKCGEQVKRSYGRFIRPGWEPCRNPARWRVDGLGSLGALYSDVPMCSVHRAKYDRAGYRSWPIAQSTDPSLSPEVGESEGEDARA